MLAIPHPEQLSKLPPEVRDHNLAATLLNRPSVPPTLMGDFFGRLPVEHVDPRGLASIACQVGQLFTGAGKARTEQLAQKTLIELGKLWAQGERDPARYWETAAQIASNLRDAEEAE